MNKRRLCLLLCAVLLFPCFGGCGGCSRAPELEEIYDRTVELVEGSRRMSVIFYGAGLPVYDRQSAIYRDLYDSDTSAYRTQYSIVDPRCGYVSVDALKAAAAEVWSPGLLEKQVFPAAFDGLSASIGGQSSIAPARFQEDGNRLYCLDGLPDRAPSQLIFDFSTLKIIRPSNATRVLLTLDCWEVDKPQSKFLYRLTLVNSSGTWLLDKVVI